MDIVQELVKTIVRTSFDSFDTKTVERAKKRIIDVVGCTVVGRNAAGCDMMLRLVKKWGGRKESTILTDGSAIPAHNAAMINSMMARSAEFDPVGTSIGGVDTPCHISATTVPTALAVAEAKNSTGKQLLTALIVGDDLAARINGASLFSRDSGWDNTGTVNAFGAAAISGRLWELDEQKMRHTLSIALNQVGGSFESIYDNTLCFKLPQALSARTGVFSAELASEGFTGAKDALLGKYGFFGLYCKTSQPDILTEGLGKVFYGDYLSKRYPSCGLTHGAIDCALDLVQRNDLRTDEIKSVALKVSPGAYRSFVGQQFEIGEVPQVNAVFSLRYTVANALLRGSVKPEHFAGEFVRDQKVVDLARNMTVTENVQADGLFTTELEVVTTDDRTLSVHMDGPKDGSIPNPLRPDEIEEKFRRNVSLSGVMNEERTEEALNMLGRLEDLENVKALVRLLC